MTNTPFVELTQRWAKKLSVFWVIFVLIGSSYFYIHEPKFRASLNLIVPDKIQQMFIRNFELEGCTKEGARKGFSLTYNNDSDCYYGSHRTAGDWLTVLLLPPISILTLSWIITFFSRRASEYKTGKKALDLISEDNYLQAYNEIENGEIQSPELWAKAFALSEGSEEKQKSIYVELRTRQLDGR